jgi:hypothetical protein
MIDYQDWTPEFVPGTTDYYPDERFTDDAEDDLFVLGDEEDYPRV